MKPSPKSYFLAFTVLAVLLFFSFTVLPFGRSGYPKDEAGFLKMSGYSHANPAWMLMPCRSFFQGKYSGTGYFRFPPEPLLLNCDPPGAQVDLFVRSLEVPNRFLVTYNGSVIAESNWLGCTSDYGPWGGPFCGAKSDTLRFIRRPGAYTLEVETLTSTRLDAWEAYQVNLGISRNN